MPPLTRWFIRVALVSFLLALVVGVLSAAGFRWAVFPVYVHLFVVGWITEMIFGVAFWMFPRHTKERPRGNAALGVATFVLLNAGLLTRVVAEPFVTLGGSPVFGRLLVAGAVLQWGAGVSFVAMIWPRVKER